MHNTAKKVYDFMNIVEQLCYTPRDMFRRDGAKEPDSDHIMKLSFLLFMVLPYVKQSVDSQKVLELALVHDLVEADVGDTPRLESDHNADVKALKKVKELEAIEKYKKMLPEPINQKIYDLFIEYEERKTPEAKLVKAFDKFEGDMQTFKEKPEQLARKLKNNRYDFVLDYLNKDVKFAENSNEPFITEMRKLQLCTAERVIKDLKDADLI